MTVKQIEKCYQKIIDQHQANIEYWREVDKDVVKTVDSVVNHQEQTALHTSFLRLAVNGQVYSVMENNPNIHPLTHLQV